MNTKSLKNSLLVVVYVALVSYFMQNAEKWIGKMDNFWGPFAFLMLFVISAAIVGYLVFGQPVVLYLDGKKKEALSTIGQTIGWLVGVTVIILIGIALFK